MIDPDRLQNLAPLFRRAEHQPVPSGADLERIGAFDPAIWEHAIAGDVHRPDRDAWPGDLECAARAGIDRAPRLVGPAGLQRVSGIDAVGADPEMPRSGK